MEAFNVKGSYHKEKHCAEIKTEHAVKAEQLKQGFQLCNCNKVMLRRRSILTGWTDTGNTCENCHGQIVEEGFNEIVEIEKDEEEEKREQVFTCEIQKYPIQTEGELTAKKRIQELENNNASLEKELAQSNKANEDLCASLSSAEKKHTETGDKITELQELIKIF